MTPVIAVVAMGEMGAGLSKCMVSAGAKVRTSLGGRSSASLERAKNAGVEIFEDPAEMLSGADLFLSVPSGDLAGLYIEMKTPKGRQSPEQLEFEQEVLEQGYGYCTPRSSREFERAVKMYLETGYYDKP